jgi:membrane-associated protease RseP (regulator of RpoE activity)
VSVFITGAQQGKVFLSHESVVAGAQFTGALLSILLAHEFGHYIAARIHKVDASLPYFIPMPLLSPFGTMGAVIRMRGVIPTRKALLDIGASGPWPASVWRSRSTSGGSHTPRSSLWTARVRGWSSASRS